MLAFKQVRLSPQQKVKKRLSRVVCFSFSSLDLKFPRSLMPPPLSDVRSKKTLSRTGGVLQQFQNNKKTIFHPTALLLLSPKLRSPSLHLLGSINILLLLLKTSSSDLLRLCPTVAVERKRRKGIIFHFIFSLLLISDQ